MTIRKVLVANRGEIARRVFRTCRERGIATVAVYSDADREAVHVAEADEAVYIGGAAAAESYLRADLILEAAKAHGCNFVLLPCCVIDEPATPPRDVHWLPWLSDQASEMGFRVDHFRLNFKGQSIGFRGTLS